MLAASYQPMKHIINLNNTTPIDLPTLIDSRLLGQANSGGGKSWLLRRILEQSHGIAPPGAQALCPAIP